MSDSSSDTTHEAILHNLVAHQRTIQRQIGELSQELQELKHQLQVLTTLLHQVVRSPSSPQGHAEAERGSDHSAHGEDTA